MNCDCDSLVRRFAAGDRRAMARLITMLDDNDPAARRALESLPPPPRRAAVVGITGAPGVGKSTLLGRMIAALRNRGRRIAVLAVDPESPISGGALLGDRCRMESAGIDDDVFIRSLSSHGAAGGLSASVRTICRLLEHFGYDLILVESVGVGQGELGVLRVADVVMLIVMPGAGDAVQWEKAGLIEVAHLVVLNKSDYPRADQTEQELTESLGAGQDRPTPPIVRTVASEGVGVERLVDTLDLVLARRPPTDWQQMRTEILQEAEMLLGERLRELAWDDAGLIELSVAAARGEVDLSAAANQALSHLLPKLPNGR